MPYNTQHKEKEPVVVVKIEDMITARQPQHRVRQQVLSTMHVGLFNPSLLLSKTVFFCFSPDWNISTAFRWVTILYRHYMILASGPQGLNFNVFGDCVTFPVAPQQIKVSCEISQWTGAKFYTDVHVWFTDNVVMRSTFAFLSEMSVVSCWMDRLEMWFGFSCSAEDEA